MSYEIPQSDSADAFLEGAQQEIERNWDAVATSAVLTVDAATQTLHAISTGFTETVEEYPILRGLQEALSDTVDRFYKLTDQATLAELALEVQPKIPNRKTIIQPGAHAGIFMQLTNQYGISLSVDLTGGMRDPRHSIDYIPRKHFGRQGSDVTDMALSRASRIRMRYYQQGELIVEVGLEHTADVSLQLARFSHTLLYCQPAMLDDSNLDTVPILTRDNYGFRQINHQLSVAKQTLSHIVPSWQ